MNQAAVSGEAQKIILINAIMLDTVSERLLKLTAPFGEAALAQDIQVMLRDGIDAARRGDKLTARRLLQQVLIQERGNETALMWMASVADTLDDRRAYLQMALQVNPRNERAREALRRLGGTPPAATNVSANRTAEPGSAAAMPPIEMRRVRGAGLSPFLIAGVAVAALLAFIVLLNLASTPQTTIPQSLPQNATVPATAFVALQATNTPAGTPTPTEFYGIIVTLDRTQVTLPPTFTLTPSVEPSPTLPPTSTPIAARDYQVIAADFVGLSAAPSLFQGIASEADDEVGDDAGYSDITLSADGSQIAFIRSVGVAEIDAEATVEGEAAPTEEGTSEALPQLFIAPVNDPSNARQVTQLTGSLLTNPSWSPTGDQLAVASNQDGDYEVYLVSVEDGTAEQVTFNDTSDITPAFAPDGASVVFASDELTPGFYELYRYDIEEDTSTRMTDTAGSSYAPAFSPDGEQIAFVNDQGGDPDIFVGNADGQRILQLTIDDNSAEDRRPGWTPDGSYIVFASNRNDDTFYWYAIPARGGTVTQVTTQNGDAQSLVFVP